MARTQGKEIMTTSRFYDDDEARSEARRLKIYFVLILLLILWLISSGCESASSKAKQIAESANKQAAENKLAIEGNQNDIKTINTSISTITTNMEQINQSMTKSVSAQFEKFEGKYLNSQKNTTNSTWMILGLALIGCGFILGLLTLIGLWLGESGIIGPKKGR
jgi:hypothetical protein